MFPDTRTSQKQRGFLLPLAIFLLVGISFLAVAIYRFSGQTGAQATVEGLSVQAFYAAESGAQLAMNRLFFNASSRAQVDANCAGVSGSNVNYSVTGLALCNAQLTCTRSVDPADTTSFYVINSVGSCGVGDLLGEREIEVSAYMQ